MEWRASLISELFIDFSWRIC